MAGSVAAVLGNGFESGHDVLGRDERLDVVDRGEEKPPPGARSSIRRRTSSRTSDGVPNGRTRWVSTPPPQKTRSRPNCCLSWRVSIPRALTWTGLTMSTPISMRCG
jgi:hypothetical protein